MALTPQLYFADLVGTRAAAMFTFGGIVFDQLAWALATAMTLWGPTVQLRGIATGSAGVGTMNVPTTKIALAPNPGIVISGLISAGMEGPLGLSLGAVAGQAIPRTISAVGQYAGGVAGVGIGGDVSKVVAADASSLTSILLTQMASFMGGAGSASAMMARGLATGIANLLLTATGAGSVIGFPSTSPGTGTSTSVMV